MTSRRTFRSLPPPDALLLFSVALIVVVGLVALTSSSGIVAYKRFGDSLFYVKRQLLFGLLPGLILFYVGLFLPYTFWRRFSRYIFWGAVLLLALVFVPGIGVSYGRAQSWLAVGAYSLQPAEIMKVALLFSLAALFERKRGILSFLFFLGLPLALIAAQPDIGTMGLVALVGLVVYFVSGAPWWHLLLMALAGGGALWGIIAQAPYRLARILSFLSPEHDPTGASYQLLQSLVAIGSGGLFGVGLGASRQKLQYLPEVAADSIFAIFAEELGFVAVGALLILFLFFAYRGFRIARHAPDTFAQLFTVGVFSWFLLQMFLNVGSMIGLLPLTGVPLPFMSYGGTALAVSLFAVGVVANISRYSRH